MFDKLIKKRDFYRKKHLEYPLLKERLDYLQYYADKGRSLSLLQQLANYLLIIINYLDLKNYKIITLEEIEKAADKWARYHYNHAQKQTGYSNTGKIYFIRYAKEWLKRLNRLDKLPEEKYPLFNKIFERRNAFKHHLDAPLLEERTKYLQYWLDNGAVDSTIRRIAQYLLVVMDYLNFHKLRCIAIKEIEEAADRWAITINLNHQKNKYSKFAKARFMRDATGWLGMLGCLEVPIKNSTPFQEYVDQYVKYLTEERGLSINTIKSRVSQLQDFCTMISKVCNSFAEIKPLTLDGILTKKYNTGNYARVTIQEYASVIRSFIRYAEEQGWCQKNLSISIKAPRIYSHESLPYSPSWDDVKKVIASSKSDYPTDIRDYAILMLLSVYGMRCSKVKNLCLEDINWEREELYLKRAKLSRPQLFPLVTIVGDAILSYLTNVRPNACKLREIFVCMKSPYRPLSSGAIYQIVSRKLKQFSFIYRKR